MSTATRVIQTIHTEVELDAAFKTAKTPKQIQAVVDAVTPQCKRVMLDEANRKRKESAEGMRRCLEIHGLCPTPKGVRFAQRGRAYILKSVIEQVRELAPTDLFSVMLVVGKLLEWPEPKASTCTRASTGKQTGGQGRAK